MLLVKAMVSGNRGVRCCVSVGLGSRVFMFRVFLNVVLWESLKFRFRDA